MKAARNEDLKSLDQFVAFALLSEGLDVRKTKLLHIFGKSAIFEKNRLDMEAYREIMDAKRLLTVMQIPKSLQGGKVEVIIVPVADQEEKKRTRQPAIGLLRNYANPTLREQEKYAWEIHLKEKYGAV